MYGGTQPDKLARLLREGDDGLLGQLLWLWPEPVPFRLGHQAPRVEWAIRALDRLRELDLQPGDPPMPIRVPLPGEGRGLLETFARDMQEQGADGLLRAAFGKARGQTRRLALVLEMLWWCGEDGASPQPTRISSRAVSATTELMGSYFFPMAQRVCGRDTVTTQDRDAAILARWILTTRPKEVHIRHLQRGVRLPRLPGKSATPPRYLSRTVGCARRRRTRGLGRGRASPIELTLDCGFWLEAFKGCAPASGTQRMRWKARTAPGPKINVAGKVRRNRGPNTQRLRP